MKKESFKEQLKEVQKEPKQLVVGGIILLVAILLLVFSFVGEKTPFKVTENVAPKPVTENTVPQVAEEVVIKEEVIVAENTNAEPETPAAESNIIEVEPEHVVVSFTANLNKDIDFQVFYTDNEQADYAEETSVKQTATPGMNNYSIVLPAKRIYRFRLDFGEYPGNVMIKDIRLAGSQNVDFNDFSQFDTNQMENIVINEDGSLSFTSEEFDPYMAYKTML